MKRQKYIDAMRHAIPLSERVAGRLAVCPDRSLDEEDLLSYVVGEINITMRNLPKRYREIILLYYGLNGEKAHTLKEVGEKYGISQERVRQIKAKAIWKLTYRVQEYQPNLERELVS